MTHLWYFAENASWYGVNSGIERVTRCLASALQALGIEVRFLRWDKAAADLAPLTDPARLEHLARWHGPDAGQWLAKADAIPLEGGWLLIPELVTHSGKATLGQVIKQARARGMRVATVFYDAIPVKLGEFYPAEFRRMHAHYMNELVESDFVAAISETSLRDLKTFLAANRGLGASWRARLESLPLPGELPGTARVASPPPPPPPPAGIPLILSVGTVEPRKNHFRLVQAFALASRQAAAPVELAIVGGHHHQEYAEKFAKLIAPLKNISWAQNCPDDQLRDFYRRCAFTVYPSLEEGFGLPVLESLWNGKACVCHDDGALAEVAQGGGCLGINARYTEEIAVAMMTLLGDTARRDRLAGEAMRRPIKSWQEYGRQFADRLAAS